MIFFFFFVCINCVGKHFTLNIHCLMVFFYHHHHYDDDIILTWNLKGKKKKEQIVQESNKNEKINQLTFNENFPKKNLRKKVVE